MTKAGTGTRSRGFGGSSLFVAGFALLGSLSQLVAGTNASAASASGVSSTSIRVGLPYLNLASLESVGLNINQGSYPDAFNALIDNLNAQGGINGRKIALSLASVNPTSTASSASACTQLTEDDNVFVAFGPIYPLCYQQAGVATINGDMGATLSPSAAPNFTLTPPAAAFDPLQISVYTEQGIFKGKKIGVIGASVDQTEIPIVLAALRKQHVDVVQSAIDSAPQGDTAANNQQIQVIAQRFESEGVKVVVGVGTGASGWLQGLNGIQSTYAPRHRCHELLGLCRNRLGQGWRRSHLSEGCDYGHTDPLPTGVLGRPRRPEVCPHHQEGLSVDCDREPDRGTGQRTDDLGRRREHLPGCGDLFRYRQGGRKEPHSPNVQAGGLWPS